MIYRNKAQMMAARHDHRILDEGLKERWI